MQPWKVKVLVILLTFLMYDCTYSQPKVESGAYRLMLKTLLSHDVQETGVAQAYGMKDKVLFLDSRTWEEYAVSHLQNARWIGYEAFDTSKVADIPKDEKIIVYCAVGARSEKITEELMALGFTDVSNLYGGIFEWVNAGYPVYQSGAVPTSHVHAYNKMWGIWLKKGNKVYTQQEQKSQDTY